MTTHFITAEIDLQSCPAEMYRAIEAELQQQGTPLRWAVTDVDVPRQKAVVEAIVTQVEVQTSQR
ncbi:hypothetical protein [Leptolyngbya sp. FACHB-261]|uniref:hypothetical protein n=1 Tax=Leptolyngbya sp. FACHB-261 TaxID=2692806 RepID=UPI001689A55F|nr:hypothetical protein [Leptolyngbya sp. FACHB-261]MBD2103428.1 hypothetical protein [Leptolyngbya sp. FACHB-261]